MTLAVAVKLERLVRNDRRFVLLMTDSRFTYLDGSPHKDDGAKTWKLADKVGAVFAGDVEIAEKTLSRVQRLLGSARPITFEGIFESFRVAFERLYRKRRPTYFLVGAVSPGGDARLFTVDHKIGPVPSEETKKLVTIGHPDAETAFWTELGRIPEGPLHQLGQDPLAEFHLHALPYVSTFARGLTSGGETVGFPMQVLLINEFGEESLHLNSLEGDAPQFKRLSAAPGEVHSLYRQPERTWLSNRMQIRLRRSDD